jgi:diacylglycerol kinase (ATP)
VVGVEALGLAEQLRLTPHLYRGTLLGRRGITFERGRHLAAEPLDPGEAVRLDVDGEAPGVLPAAFEVRPGALLLRG